MAVTRKNQHVRFGLAGGNFREHFPRGRIDDVYRVGKFCGDIQQAVRSKFGAVRPKPFAKINGAGKLVVLQINDVNRASIHAGPPDPGVSIDRNVREAAILRNDDFVAVHANDHFRELAAALGINNKNRVLHLIRHDEQPPS